MAVTQTPRLGLYVWSAGSDPFTRTQMTESHDALEDLVAIVEQGTASARPSAGTEGRFYFATDTLVLSYDTGVTWRDVAQVNGAVASGTAVTVDLYGEVTSGTIQIGEGLTTGKLYLATVGTGATDIKIGHANATITLGGTVASPTISTPTLTLANTSPTADGGIGWAQSTDSLQVGDGTNSKPIHLGAWQSYTPTVYNWTGGDLSGAYVRVGNTVHFRAKFSTNFSSTHSGTFEMSLPVTSSSNSPVLIGGATVYIWSTSAYYVGWVARISTTRVNVWLPNPTATTDGEKTTVTGSKPVVFSAGGDYVEVAGTYEAA